MIKADLQVHSKYSSHALYMPSKKIMAKLESEYPKSAFFEGELWWMQFVAIDGVSGIEKILTSAKKVNLSAVAITDHNTTLGSIQAQRLSENYGIVTIPAMELSTSEGELLTYGIHEKLPFRITPEEAIEIVHSQGGVVAIPHPFLRSHSKTDYATFSRERILSLNVDAVDTFSPIFGFSPEWSDFAKQNNLAEIGSSDAHMDFIVGTVWTEFPDECKTPADFIEAIKYRKTKANGIQNRKSLLLKAVAEYIWKNGLGRLFIKF